jgi:hypothetical protein
MSEADGPTNQTNFGGQSSALNPAIISNVSHSVDWVPRHSVSWAAEKPS